MDHLLHVIHNLHWSTTAREGAHHCRYSSKVQGTGPPAYTAQVYKSTHQLCTSQRAVENGDGDCREWNAELCPTMLLLMVAGGGVRARTMLAEASVGGGLVDGCSFWQWERRAELLQRCDGGGGIGRRCCVAKRCCWVTSSGWRCCGRSGGGA